MTFLEALKMVVDHPEKKFMRVSGSEDGYWWGLCKPDTGLQQTYKIWGHYIESSLRKVQTESILWFGTLNFFEQWEVREFNWVEIGNKLKADKDWDYKAWLK